jgi:hypothetical protein
MDRIGAAMLIIPARVTLIRGNLERAGQGMPQFVGLVTIGTFVSNSSQWEENAMAGAWNLASHYECRKNWRQDAPLNHGWIGTDPGRTRTQPGNVRAAGDSTGMRMAV